MGLWYDRVLGLCVNKLPNAVVSGRFVANESYVLNEHTILEKGDFLLNDGTVKFQVNNDKGRFLENDKTEKEITEFGIVESAILAYQEAIDKDVKSSFLIPETLLVRFELSGFEELLYKIINKGHLQEIARRPRMELIYEEYLVPVSRAKKIATSANQHLASHSECWQARTLTGIIPKKVLALESEDQLNIYENRVYVKLIGYVEKYLVKRIYEVQRLEELFKDAINFQDADDIYFELGNSIFELWGEGFSNDTNADVAASKGKTTLSILGLMLKKIRTLQNSKLYRSLSFNLHVPLKLNMTNILSHDQHYRYVARLWTGWLEIQHKDQVEAEYVYKRNKKIANSYTNYCFNLIKRTLFELGYNEKDNCFEREGSSPLKIVVNEKSEIILYREKTSLYFVPCFTESYIDEFVQEDKESQRILLSLYSESNVENKMLCISPTNFYSLEQISILITEWQVKQTYKLLGSEIKKVPTSILNELDAMNEQYWDIKQTSILVSKPFLSLGPKISDFMNKNNRDITVQRSGEEIIKTAENFEALLCCPCCGTKVDESQWIVRDDSCFSIRHSSCKHSWEVNRQANGSKVLIIKPVKNDGASDIFGRYKMDIAL